MSEIDLSDPDTLRATYVVFARDLLSGASAATLDEAVEAIRGAHAGGMIKFELDADGVTVRAVWLADGKH